jgi:hypothetical protein
MAENLQGQYNDKLFIHIGRKIEDNKLLNLNLALSLSKYSKQKGVYEKVFFISKALLHFSTFFICILTFLSLIKVVSGQTKSCLIVMLLSIFLFVFNLIKPKFT